DQRGMLMPRSSWATRRASPPEEIDHSSLPVTYRAAHPVCGTAGAPAATAARSSVKRATAIVFSCMGSVLLRDPAIAGEEVLEQVPVAHRTHTTCGTRE